MSASPLPETLRLLLVEDDFVQACAAQLALTNLGYEVVGVAATAAEAERLFEATSPDLLLLDVHLGGGPDGIDVAHRLLARQRVPLIFLTSFQDAETFRRARAVGPAAFLAKPFDELVLGHAIELAAQQFVQPAGPAHTSAAPPLPAADSGLVLRDALWVRENNRLVRVPLASVQWLEADGNHCHLHTTGGRKHTVRITLSELEDRLPGADFMRVHRSFIIRLAASESLDLGMNEINLHGGGVVPLGRAHRDDLMARLELLS